MGQSGVGWKQDVAIHDRVGWSSRFRGRGRLSSPDGERVYLRFEELERTTHYGDYFFGQHFDKFLVSPDGGRSWAHATGTEDLPQEGVLLADGTRIQVARTVATYRGEALRAYLEAAGLSQLWHQDAFAWWDIASVAHRPELERQGLFLAHVLQPLEFVAYLRDMSVGVLRPDSSEWSWSRMEGLPPLCEMTDWWRQRGIALADGTIMGTVRGRVRSEDRYTTCYALRSTDRGRSWELRPIASATERAGFSESFLLPLADGRVLATIRSTDADVRIYQSTSEDGGLTWSEPERTPIHGLTAHLLQLRSGAILCTYTSRNHPLGIRGVLSRDGGRTWDVAAEKVIRDDGYGTVGYPASIQLADDSILTAYELGKPVRSERETLARAAATGVQPGQRPAGARYGGPGAHEDRMDPDGRAQSYLAASRYTEDWVAPLGH